MGVNLPCVSQTTVKRVFWHSNDLRRIDRAPLGVFAHPVGYSVKLSFARMILSDVLNTSSMVQSLPFVPSCPYKTPLFFQIAHSVPDGSVEQIAVVCQTAPGCSVI